MVNPIADAQLRRQRARRGLVWYFALLIPLTALLEGIIIAVGQRDILLLMLVWVPAVSATIARIARREGFADVSFRFGGRRGAIAIFVGVLFPILIGGTAYGLAWTSGLARYDPGAGFPVLLVQAATIGTLIGVILTAGEELGWRGYLLTRLIDADVPRPVLVTGIIWGLWHLPLILAGRYDVGPNRLVSAVVFMVTITAIGYVFAWSRLWSGSIWPTFVIHAAWNAIIGDAFDKATVGPNALLWTGEAGIIVAATLLVAAVLFTRWRWTTRRLSPPTAALAGATGAAERA